MNKLPLLKYLFALVLGLAGAWMLINSPQPKTAVAQTNETYTSRWTVEKWMNANMRFGGDCGGCYTGGDRVQREVQGDTWTKSWYNRPFTIGPAAWKVVMTLDGGSTNVCEKWRLTRFRSSNDSNDTNIYGESYAFPNDDSDRRVVNERLDGTAVLIYGDEATRGFESYIPDRWRIERSGTFLRRDWIRTSGKDYQGSLGAYGITLLESANWHAGLGENTDVDEALTIFPTEWTVSGTIGASNC